MASALSSRPKTVHRFTLNAETDDCIVVNKPPFSLSHPTKPSQQTTLWKELRELLAFEIANGENSNDPRFQKLAASQAPKQ
jgi:23S rRNA-/tRNA-specific pseudouridylate synthase